ncbi:putative white-brown complex [Ananas comosus]|uniref:Putative white-brown complex n=1 Tax=Ananas comosus TaxID=4615 RepID=A0A199W5X1_ANACO|nr:putative white-brown complex [Ananas comosus]
MASFCPRPETTCPLGAYCPLGTLNGTTGLCDPYNYQLPPGNPNHTCGTADKWADVASTTEIFCPPGYYCPTTVQKINCSSGYCFLSSIVVALSLLLLIIYNCYGQFLTIRERRQAKSRESGARLARESVMARERWKAATDIARKHVVELSAQLSRTFSCRMSFRQQSQVKVLGHSQQSSESPISMNNEPSNATVVMRSVEGDSEMDEASNLEVGGKIFKKGKHRHTNTEIFRYAYRQIEKEKALQEGTKNLTLSGLISMATELKPRTRPLLEVAFNDLTLTLGTRKLLHSITGKLMPGRITAVMGPSGAGKTTFLNALSGKATGCKMSGLVLINGKVGQIRSYRKIIGFVPQDDIVHGNLTVEENLWFSARCRLSAGMSKADKILVVERVIESLGLQAIRNSLVGTVEKRGISGGQRKRVNVGLEMVMEPSLLILDEPTSGLDSASSQLLLRALRREALEGVNICMVVHQPSYTLFKMFDDLILLAKGGLTVYHGPVDKVEDYFAGLGINVPERVNPPDHFIDILEGMVKPNSTTTVTCKQLPLQWMLYNGYEIPPNMQDDLKEMDASVRSSEPGSARSLDGQSVSDEVWGNVRCGLGREEDKLGFSKSYDLTNRKTPGILIQYKHYLGRVTKQRLREARIQAVDYLILGLAGVCLGTIAKVSDESFGSAALLCKIGALRSFSLEGLQYWRERESGMSSLAYFLSKDTIDHFNTLVKPVVYLSMFYFFNNPRSSFVSNYAVLVALVYCVTGIGYTFAICFQQASAQLVRIEILSISFCGTGTVYTFYPIRYCASVANISVFMQWSALLPVVLTLISTQHRSPKFLTNFCYPKWALEGFIIVTAQRYSGVWLITRCGVLFKSRYDINDWAVCIAVLFIYGLIFRTRGTRAANGADLGAGAPRRFPSRLAKSRPASRPESVTG